MSISGEQFVENLSSTTLLSKKNLAALKERLSAAGEGQDGESLARSLIEAGRLTEYQAEAICEGKTDWLEFGEYRVLDRIGAGGMGEVLRGKHRSLDRIVAIKVLPEKSVGALDIVERFHNEMRASAKVNHPNIVTAYDAGQKGDLHFLVLEYLEGRDLASVVDDDGQPMSVDVAVDVILQSARGLEQLHAKRVYHRDIKPANLFLTNDGTVKVLDLGLARLADEEEADKEESDGATKEAKRLTVMGQIMGTCDYIAPEQAENTRDADARSDIYSLGCTLYRLLTGGVPYPAENFVKQLMAHAGNPIPSLIEARPNVPAALNNLYEKMLAKKPADRPQTMTEVIGALDAILRGDNSAGTADEPDAALTDFLDHMKPSSAATAASRTQGPSGTAAKTATPVKEKTAPTAEETIDLKRQDDTSRSVTADEAAEMKTPAPQPAAAAEPDAGQKSAGKEKSAPAKPRSRASARRKKQTLPLLLIGIGVGISLIGAAVVGAILYIQTNYGTIIVDARDENIQVSVKQGGDEIYVVDANNQWRIDVKAGEYHVEIKGGHDRLTLDNNTITVTRGGELRVRVERKPQQIAEAKKPPKFAVAPFEKDEANEHQKAWAKYLGLPVEWTNSVGIKFVLLPPGEFRMGSTQSEIERALREATENGLADWYTKLISAEGPQHLQRIDRPIYMGQVEVTVGQFRRFVEATNHETVAEKAGKEDGNPEHVWHDPTVASEDDYPVVFLAWSDANAFCKWLSDVAGASYRIPTEAEWEFACRAGTTTAFSSGERFETLEGIANIVDRSFKVTFPDRALASRSALWDDGFPGAAPVGSLGANPFGLHDMHGNVWEWCQEWFDAKAYERYAQGDFRPPNTGDERAVRGGSWVDFRPYHRVLGSAGRRGFRPDFRTEAIGFRLVCEIPMDSARRKTFATAIRAATATPPAEQRFFHGDLQALPDGRVEFVYDWSDPAQLQDWGDVADEDPAVENGLIRGSPGIHKAVFRDEMEISTSWTLHQKTYWAGQANMAVCVDMPDYYRAALMAVETSIFKKGKVDVERFHVELPEGQRHTCRLARSGDSLKLWINDQLVVDTTDPDRHGGAVELGAWRADVTFGSASIIGRLDPDWLAKNPAAAAQIEALNRGQPVGVTGQQRAPSADDLTVLPNGWQVGEPVSLGPTVNTPDSDAAPAISRDGLQLVFQSTRPGGLGMNDLWISKRASTKEAFGRPINLGSTVNSQWEDSGPALSSTGLTLLFDTTRLGRRYVVDVWTCSRPSLSGLFGDPTPIAQVIDCKDGFGAAFLSSDDLTLLFHSTLPGGQGESDLWLSRRASPTDPFGEAVNLGPAVNSSDGDYQPALSADDLVLFFDSNRPGGYGDSDIWMSTRPSADDPFGKPINLGPLVNSGQSDGAPAISADGRTLFYQSKRPGGMGEHDIWQCPIEPPRAGGVTEQTKTLSRAVAPFSPAEAKQHQEAWAKHLDVPVDYTNPIDMKFTLIPPGEFMMGTSEEQIQELLQEAKDENLEPWYFDKALPAERPQHEVRITRPFYLGKHEVTVRQFREFVRQSDHPTDAEKPGTEAAHFDPTSGKYDRQPQHNWENPGFAQTDEHPVVDVTWNDAVAYCAWVSAKTGCTCRLPTEAEWEYSCRAGSDKRYFFGDDPQQLAQYAWIGGNSANATHPVGEKEPNPWGACDMYGNVWEWCRDRHGAYVAGVSPEENPGGPDSGPHHVIRGSGWHTVPPCYRSAFRLGFPPSVRHNDGGFRVVCEIPLDPDERDRFRPDQPAEYLVDLLARGRNSDVAFQPDGRHVLVAPVEDAEDMGIFQLDLETGQADLILKTAGRPIALDLASSDRIVLVGDNKGVASVWDLKTRKLIHAVPHPGQIMRARLSQNSRVAITSCQDGKTRVLDLPKGKVVHTIDGPQPLINAAPPPGVVTSDGRFFVTNGDPVVLWNAENGEAVRTLWNGPGWVQCLTPNDEAVLVACDDRKSRSISVADAQVLVTWDEDVRSSAVDPGGRYLAGSVGGIVVVYDLKTGDELWRCKNGKGAILHIGVCPESQKVVAVLRDGMVRVWQVPVLTTSMAGDG